MGNILFFDQFLHQIQVCNIPAKESDTTHLFAIKQKRKPNRPIIDIEGNNIFPIRYKAFDDPASNKALRTRH
ncbi:MAG: hypothetical protein BWY82_02708 [Verrucomicrobia bacterium ADurb.Bin474]|nr:MAG: hypothetical protein BWY82_02708 [Verrucomicrobia bacterium ADurb.Bin474]